MREMEQTSSIGFMSVRVEINKRGRSLPETDVKMANISKHDKVITR